MILVFENVLAVLLNAATDALGIVAEPNADRNGEAVFLRLVEIALGVLADSPGAEGIATGFGQHVFRPAAAAALDKVGLAVAGELPAGAGLHEHGFHRSGAGGNKPERADKQEGEYALGGAIQTE